jgi:hypothetical protein
MNEWRKLDPQRRTTVAMISIGWWEERRDDIRLEQVFGMQIDLALILSIRCKMDILSVSHSPFAHDGLHDVVVVCLNNGMSLEAIVEAMQPEINVKRGWLLQDAYVEMGAIQLVMSIEGKESQDARGKGINVD